MSNLYYLIKLRSMWINEEDSSSSPKPIIFALKFNKDFIMNKLILIIAYR